MDAYLDVLDEEAFTPEMREVTRRQFHFIRLSRERIFHLREVSDPSHVPVVPPTDEPAAPAQPRSHGT